MDLQSFFLFGILTKLPTKTLKSDRKKSSSLPIDAPQLLLRALCDFDDRQCGYKRIR